LYRFYDIAHMGTRTTICDLAEMPASGRKIVAVSCYDYTTARLVAQAQVDLILVGDSAAQVVLGHDSTLPATMDFMVAITAAVRRGAPDVYLVADMPFLSYQVGVGEAVRNAGRFVAEAGAQMVKIEATAAQLSVVRAVSDAGMAVMAHIGIRPQQIGKVGRFRAEATTAEMATDLITLAWRMVEAGASMLLLEGTAAEVAKIVTESVPVPVISCGSGSDCDGQILIAPDILGLTEGRLPKFSRAYADGARITIEALNTYSQQVKSGQFPDHDHSYHMKPGELDRLRTLLEQPRT